MSMASSWYSPASKVYPIVDVLSISSFKSVLNLGIAVFAACWSTSLKFDSCTTFDTPKKPLANSYLLASSNCYTLAIAS